MPNLVSKLTFLIIPTGIAAFIACSPTSGADPEGTSDSPGQTNGTIDLGDGDGDPGNRPRHRPQQRQRGSGQLRRW